MFAAVLLFLAGTWNFIQGVLGALEVARLYVEHPLRLQRPPHLGLDRSRPRHHPALRRRGPAQRQQRAVWFAIAVAGVNAIGQLMFLPAYPVWALAMFTLDILIIYGLVLYHGTVQALQS